MKPISNYFFIDIEQPNITWDMLPGTSGILNMSGNYEVVNKDFNKYEHFKQSGIITHAPDRIKNDPEFFGTPFYINDQPIKVGDKVWFHHSAFNEENEVKIPDGRTVHRLRYESIYAVEKDGKLFPTEQNVFIRPLFESEADIISKTGLILKCKPGKIPMVGVVVAASKHCQKLGIKEGVKILYSKLSEYIINDMVPVTYKSDVKWIYGVFEDDKLIPIRG